jgi:hypothetical protein
MVTVTIAPLVSSWAIATAHTRHKSNDVLHISDRLTDKLTLATENLYSQL